MKLLKDLIQAKSYEGDYSEIIKVIVDFVRQNTKGKVIEQKIAAVKSNIIVCFGNPELVINCHMDTVAPSDRWDHPPLELLEKEDRFYGLGTTDTKGNIFMLLKAVEKMQPENLMLLFSVDEESGSKTGAAYFLESEYKKGLKRAIVCEPTSLKFARRHKGVYSFIVENTAQAGHSSLSGSSAVVEAAKNIIELDAHHYNIGRVECSNASNVIAQYCRFKASIRTYEEAGSVFETIKSLCPKASVTPSFAGPPLNNDSPDFKGDFCEVDFWTEASLFQNSGISSVVFGAGSIEQAHSANEYIQKLQLEEGRGVIEKIIEEEDLKQLQQKVS